MGKRWKNRPTLNGPSFLASNGGPASFPEVFAKAAVLGQHVEPAPLSACDVETADDLEDQKAHRECPVKIHGPDCDDDRESEQHDHRADHSSRLRSVTSTSEGLLPDSGTQIRRAHRSDGTFVGSSLALLIVPRHISGDMIVNVCPAAVTSAPPDRIWRVLTDARTLQRMERRDLRLGGTTGSGEARAIAPLHGSGVRAQMAADDGGARHGPAVALDRSPHPPSFRNREPRAHHPHADQRRRNPGPVQLRLPPPARVAGPPDRAATWT